MTRDERLASIRAWERSGKATALFDIYADIRFLLAELDAAEARAQRLTEALTAIDCAYRLRQTCIEANRRPELMCSRCAALAEGEDTRG